MTNVAKCIKLIKTLFLGTTKQILQLIFPISGGEQQALVGRVNTVEVNEFKQRNDMLRANISKYLSEYKKKKGYLTTTAEIPDVPPEKSLENIFVGPQLLKRRILPKFDVLEVLPLQKHDDTTTSTTETETKATVTDNPTTEEDPYKIAIAGVREAFKMRHRNLYPK